jgi:hypothetical protein
MTASPNLPAPVPPLPASVFAPGLAGPAKAEVVREVYKKHAAELLAIEEAQQKLTLLLLGVFGAGASFLASEKGASALSVLSKCGLSIVTAAILLVGWRYTRRRDHARASVRNLLTDCEVALGLYAADVYVAGQPLYTAGLIRFPERGGWLSATYWIATLAAVGFVIVLWAA